MANNFSINLGVNISATDLQTKINQISKGLKGIDLKVDSSSLQKMSTTFSEVAKTGQKLQTINAQIKDQYGQIIKTTQTWNVSTSELVKSTNTLLTSVKQQSTEQQKYNTLVKQGKQLATQQAQALSNTKQKAIYSEMSSNQKQMYSLQQKLLSAETLETQELNKQINVLALRNKYLNYKADKNGLSSSDYQKQLDIQKQIYENQLKINQARAADNSIATTIKQEENLANQMSVVSNRAKAAQSNFSSYLKSLKPAALKSYSTEINNISKSFSDAAKSGNQMDLSKANSQLAVFKSRMKETGMQAASLSQILKNNIAAFTNWLLIGNVVTSVFRGFKEGVSFVAELDDALTNINYTMDVTSSQLTEIGSSSIDMAKDLSTSATNVLEAVKLYANANETAQSILAKAQPAIMLSNVTDLTPEDSAKALQAVQNQFDLTEDDLMHISDVIETVSQNMSYDFSSGISEIVEGIETAGSTAESAGYDIERFSSLLGVLIQNTGLSGSTLANSLRTMMSRVSKASTSALAGGEVTEDDLSNAETALRRVGIEVRSDIDSFKDFDDVMGELYNKVDTLSDVDLANIGYEVAGVRNVNTFKAMIKSYGEYLDMVDTVNSTSGTTLQNQETYANSLQGKLSGLTATWQSIWSNTVNSSGLKFIVDVGAGVSKLVESTHLLQAALLGLAGLGIFKGGTALISWLSNAISSTLAFGSALNTVNAKGFVSNYINLGNAIRGLSEKQAIAILSTQNLDATTIKAAMSCAGFTAEEQAAAVATLTVSAAEDKASVSTLGWAGSLKALTAAMLESPIALAVAAITALSIAVPLATKAYDALTTSIEEQTQAVEDAKSAYEDTQSELESITSELEEQSATMDELLAKDKLTYAEESQLQELKDTTAELQIQLDLLKKKAEYEQKELASDAADLVTDKYGDTSEEEINKLIEEYKTSGRTSMLATNENDISSMLAAYKVFSDLKDESTDSDYIQTVMGDLDDLSESLWSTAANLQEQKANMEEYYQAIADIPIDELTSDQKEIKESYENASSTIKLIYKELDPNKWNDTQITDIFNTDGLEATKEELVSLASAGKLDEDTLKSYNNLNDAIENTDFILENGQTKIQAFLSDINALANSGDGIVDTATQIKSSLDGYSDTVTSIADSSSSLSDLMSDINEQGYITQEQYTTLSNLGTEYADLIDYQNGKMTINRDLSDELIKNKSNETYENIKLANSQAKLQYNKNAKQISKLESQLDSLTSAQEDQRESIESQIDSLENDNSAIDETITKYQLLASQLQETSSAFTAFQEAQEAPNTGDDYDTALDAMDAIQEGFETGKVDTEAFNAALELLVPDSVYDDLDTVQDKLKAIENYYDNTLSSLFTNDEDYGSDPTGVVNFLNESLDKGLMTGDMDYFEIADGTKLQDFADELGLTVDTVKSLLGELDEYTAWSDFDYLDEIFGEFDPSSISDQLAELESQKKAVYDELNNTDDVEEVEKLNDQLKELQGYEEKLNSANTEYVATWTDLNQKASEVESKLKKLYQKQDSRLFTQEDADEMSELENQLEDINSQKDQLEEPTTIQLNAALDDVTQQLSDINEQIDQVKSSTADGATLNVRTRSEELDSLEQQKSELENQQSNIETKLTIDNSQAVDSLDETQDEVDATNDKIDDLNDNDITTAADVAISNAQSYYNKLQEVQNKINTINSTPISVSGSVSVSYSSGGATSGISNGDSTSGHYTQLNGTAYANGKYGATENGTALMGEVAPEIQVHADTGQWELIQNPQFKKVKKGDVVFNGEQTKQLLNSGKIDSFGQMNGSFTGAKSIPKGLLGGLTNLAGTIKKGAAYVTGSPMSFYFSQTKSTAKGYTAQAEQAAEEAVAAIEDGADEVTKLSETFFDWIEIKLDRLEQKTKNWLNAAEAAMNYKSQKKYYKKTINSAENEIEYQNKAYSRYMKQANAVDLSASYKKKVRNGTIDIDTITDDDLKDKIETYQEFYEKAQDANEAIGDLIGDIQEYAEELYNLPLEYAEEKIEKLEASTDLLTSKIENMGSISAERRNDLLDEITANAKAEKQASKKALKQANTNLDSAIDDVTTKAMKKALKKAGTSYTKGEEIDTTNLTGDALVTATKYNEALEAQQEAQQEAAQAAEDYTATLRENTQAKLDNILSETQSLLDLADARKSASLENITLKEAQGKTVTASDYDTAIYETGLNIDRYKQLIADYTAQYEATKSNLSTEQKREAQSQIAELTESLYEAQEALIDYQDAINELKLDALDDALDKLESISDETQSQMDLLEAQGKSVSESYYQSLISNSEQQISNLEAQNALLKSQQSGLETTSDKYLELQSQIDENTQAIYDAEIAQEEWNDAIDQIPIDTLNDTLSALTRIKDAYSALLDLQEAQGLIQTDSQIEEQINQNNDLIKANEDLLAEYTEQYNEAVSAGESDKAEELSESLEDVTEQILSLKTANEELADTLLEARQTALQDELDALNDLNDAQNERIKLEEALYDLEQAQNQRTNKILRNGQWVYEADTEAIKDAQENLADIEFDQLTDSIEDAIDSLDDLADAFNLYDSEGNSLDQYEIISQIESAADAIVSGISDAIANSGYSLTGYASGTSSATAGLHKLNENGDEIIIRKTSAGDISNLSYGDAVIPSDISKNLMKFAVDPYNYLSDVGVGSIELPPTGASNSTTNSFSFGDINVYDVDDAKGLAKEINNSISNAMKQTMKR